MKYLVVSLLCIIRDTFDLAVGPGVSGRVIGFEPCWSIEHRW